MGLLEKAMEFKKKNYADGKKTVMDTVPGPAVGDVVEEPDELTMDGGDVTRSDSVDEVLYLNTMDLQEVAGDALAAGITADGDANRGGFTNDEFDSDAEIVEIRDIDDVPRDALGVDGASDGTVKSAVVMPDGLSAHSASEGRGGGRYPDIEDDLLDLPTVEEKPKRGTIPNVARAAEAMESTPAPQGGREDGGHYRAIREISPDGHDAGVETEVDYLAVYELSREILRAENQEELIDIILFSIMGQIGVSSSSIMLPLDGEGEGWGIAESRGMSIEKGGLTFSRDTGILHELLDRRVILDVEDFINHPTLQADYYSYIAFDARMLVPLLWNETVLGVVILGNKLTSDNYTSDERTFLTAIADISGIVLHDIHNHDSLRHSINILEKEVLVVRDIASLQGRVLAGPDTAAVRVILQAFGEQAGLAVYAFFVRDRANDSYIPWLTDRDDILGLAESRFSIAMDANLVTLLNGAAQRLVFKDPRQEAAMADLFTERQLSQIDTPRVYPVIIRGTLLGFFAAFKLNETADNDAVDTIAECLVRSLLPTITIMRDLEFQHGAYVDTVEGLFRRVSREVRHAGRMGIPLTLVLFSIKNFKRYHAIFGEQQSVAMLEKCESLIKSRLSSGDFAVRFDRHKIVAVLPGKDKKYAVPFSSTIVNEMIHIFSTREVQLLVTALFAEYPHDGDDVHRLLDSLEA